MDFDLGFQDEMWPTLESTCPSVSDQDIGRISPEFGLTFSEPAPKDRSRDERMPDAIETCKSAIFH
jgi:hypothetical protein